MPESQPDTLLDLFVKIGSLLGAIAFFYTLKSNTRNVPRFKYDMWSFSGVNTEKDTEDVVHFNCTFDGFVTNTSTESNYLKSINLVVWKDSKKRTETLRYGSHPSSILDKAGGGGVSLPLPIEFKPKEGKRLEIKFHERATGTADEKIVLENKPRLFVLPSNPLLRWIISLTIDRTQRSGYQLLFEDTKGNHFDENGALVDTKLMGLYWTLSNYQGRKRLREYIKIFYRKMFLLVKKVAFQLGFY